MFFVCFHINSKPFVPKSVVSVVPPHTPPHPHSSSLPSFFPISWAQFFKAFSHKTYHFLVIAGMLWALQTLPHCFVSPQSLRGSHRFLRAAQWFHIGSQQPLSSSVTVMLQDFHLWWWWHAPTPSSAALSPPRLQKLIDGVDAGVDELEVWDHGPDGSRVD